MFDLHGKVAVVTGGNGGLGKSMARGLARAGAGVAIAARDQEKTKMTVNEIRDEFGVPVIGVPVDVRVKEQIESMLANVLDALGRVDILVNNAGINIKKFPQEFDTAEWDAILEINLRGSFLCAQAVYPVMQSQGGGKIINVGSMTSIMGGGRFAPYAASKGGIVQMGRDLAVAWGPANIQVNTILPGWIDTEMTRITRRIMTDLQQRVEARTPAGRWGTPGDLEGIAVFLASPASDFLTGTAIPVDGGFSITL